MAQIADGPWPVFWQTSLPSKKNIQRFLLAVQKILPTSLYILGFTAGWPNLPTKTPPIFVTKKRGPGILAAACWLPLSM